MMKRIIYILILFIFIVGCKDKIVISNKTDLLTDSLSLYFIRADNHTLLRPERIAAILKAEDFVLKQKQDSLYLKNLFKIANRYYDIGEIEASKKTTLLIAQKAYKIKDSFNIAKAEGYLGDCYRKQSHSDSAYLAYSKAEKIYKNLKDQECLGQIYLNKAYLFYDQGDYLRSQISVFEALTNIQDRKNNDGQLFEIYNLIGTLLHETKQYEEAINYYTKAFNLAKDDLKIFKIHTLNNLGVTYKDLGKYKEANTYYKKALQNKNIKKEIPSLYAMLLDNLAYSQLQLKEYAELPQLFYKALSIRDSLQITPGIIVNKLHLSEYYQDQKDTIKAIQYAQEAYTLAKEKDIDPRNILLSLKRLKVVDSLNSIQYSDEYTAISDSLKRTTPLLPDKMIQAAHEAKDLALQKAELEEHNKDRIIGFSVLLFCLILLFILFYRKYKNKESELKQQKSNQEINELLSEQQIRIEAGKRAERERIAKELHDGIISKLAGTRIIIGALNNNLDNKSRQKALKHIDGIQSIEQDIKSISYDLNMANSLIGNNFETLLRNELKEQKEILLKTEIRFSIDSAIEWDDIRNDIKMNLYRIVQETFQNIYKYAQAKKVTVTIFEQNNHLEIQITDNGVGFNTKQQQQGIGLKNIRSRVETVKGTIKIVSCPEQGTSILIHIPL